MRSLGSRLTVLGIMALMVLFLFACAPLAVPSPTPISTPTADHAATESAATAQANGEATRIALAVAQALTASAPTLTQTPTVTATPTAFSTPTEVLTETDTDTPLPTNTLRPIPTNTTAPKLRVSLKVVGYQNDGRPYVADDGTCWSSLSDPARLFTVEVIVTNLSDRSVGRADWIKPMATNNVGQPVLMACYYHAPAPVIPLGATGVRAIKVWVETGQFVSKLSFRLRNVTYQQCYDSVPREVPC